MNDINMIRIREFEEQDLKRGYIDVLSNLSSYRYTHYNESMFSSIYQKYKDTSTVTIYVAVVENKIVGTIKVIIDYKFFSKNVCHIEDVSVHKDYQRKGIGKMLMKKAISMAKRNNCYKIQLTSLEENVVFYEKCGLYRCGVEMLKEISEKSLDLL